jgi:hypothetical protein
MPSLEKNVENKSTTLKKTYKPPTLVRLDSIEGKTPAGLEGAPTVGGGGTGPGS